jgi:hypothetical protein
MPVSVRGVMHTDVDQCALINSSFRVIPLGGDCYDRGNPDNPGFFRRDSSSTLF